MASRAAIERLTKEFLRLQKEPVENIEAKPTDSNILEWHYVVRGPVDSPFAGGVYHGKLLFPKTYPYKPPSILMLTPNGRFKTNTRLCLSMSDFHPETWNPLWSVASILSGLLSFMLETQPTYGSMDSSVEQKKKYASAALEFNIQSEEFRMMFPKYRRIYIEECRKRGVTVSSNVIEEERKERLDDIAANSLTPSPTMPSAAAPSSASLSSSSSHSSSSPTPVDESRDRLLGVDEEKLTLIGNVPALDHQQLVQTHIANQRILEEEREKKARKREELFDKVTIVVLILVIVFAISYLYR